MYDIFHIYAANGQENFLEMNLPATDYEMLDMMERLHLKEGELPYLEVLKFREEYSYLERCVHEQPDIYAATDCEKVADMVALTAEVDDYFVDASIHTPEDVARSELSVVLCSVDEETLLPHIDLDGYGRALLKRDQSMVTGYGLVERKDHQPVQRMEHGPRQGGMEMSL